LGLASAAFAYSQSNQTVLTGAVFLRVSPDARAGGMGDQGVATSSDVFSQYWNAAKYPFKVSSGVGLNYTLVKQNYQRHIPVLSSFYTFIGDDERSTLSASINYFNMGEVQLSELPWVARANRSV
jgi:hypothetical protein